MKEVVQEMANKMLESYLAFLPIDDAMSIRNVEVKSEMNYVVFYEELENDYHSNKEDLFNEAKEFFGEDNFYEIKSSEEDFEVSVCPAPTYIELLKWLKEN